MSTPARESDGLVLPPLASPVLQPWEVWDQSPYDVEMLRVCARSWLWMDDTEDQQRECVFIMGQADGTINGFLNSGRHRASALTAEPAGNCGHTLTCPYHNWAYSNDGTLIGIPDKARMYPDGFPMSDYGLVPIRVHVAWDKL